ncbi:MULTISPECIES: LysR family transcriptional regulator [unclassified Brenneria]|uniref:LysR family transcriptional regulator n=1 Tax=unclassified Brenneria TaxID=2634434 RepID=UPI0029C20F46|nr:MULTISPECIES: LysR family transcriptional regulator [unclassified Brenneria]MDX5630054.1 LysR family transcriptional regulator [Brenneria sp. L3-3Z]MDX5697200.1 LysR family transcriptional regulator [Brenneria sp. L4-2C]
MISIKRVIYYQELIRVGSFTKAAKTLNISQAFLSQEIARLEIETQRKLINRTTRQFSLTPFGRIFAKKIRPLIKEHYELEQFVSSYEESSEGTLLVGVIPIFNRLDYYNVFSLFQKNYPNIEISFIDGVSTHLLEKVRNTEIHISFSTPFDEYLNDPLFNHSVFLVDDIVVVMAASHPLAKSTALNLTRLANNKLIVPQKGTGEHAMVSETFSKMGINPCYFRECSNIDIIMDLVMNQSGVVFLCASVARSLEGYDIAIVPLEEQLKRTFAVSYLKRSINIPMVRLFVDFLEKHDDPFKLSND